MSPPKRVFTNPRFLVAALVGSLVVGVASAVAPLATQIAILGVIVCILAGLVLSWLEEQAKRDAERAALSSLTRVIEALDDKPELSQTFRRIGEAFLAISEHREPVLESCTATKLLSIAVELDLVSRGTILFRGTEAWRTAYQALLQSTKVRRYRSVAWVKRTTYWQDAPGRQSMRDNYDAINRGVVIERILILPQELWPPGQLLPSESILTWIKEQHNHGLWLMLCLEDDIESEPDLPSDFGIYDSLAVGTQSLDDECRTHEFLLEFSPEAVKLADERWQRIKLHATPLRTLLDTTGGPK